MHSPLNFIILSEKSLHFICNIVILIYIDNDVGNDKDKGDVEKNIVRLQKRDINRSGKIDSKQPIIRCGARANVTCPSYLECTGYLGNDIFFTSDLVQNGICTPSKLLHIYIIYIVLTMIDRSFEHIEYAIILL